ncbi:MAG: ABC transporter permease subunit [Promethearchaeota archaeon]
MKILKNRIKTQNQGNNLVNNIKKPFKISWTELISSKKGILLYSILMFLFVYWFMSIYDPELFAGFEDFYDNFPPEILQMIGGQLSLAEFGGFVNTYIFAFAWMYMGIYLIIRSSQDIPKEIDNKTIDIMLSKPIKRWQFVSGKYIQHLIVTIGLAIAAWYGMLIGLLTVPALQDIEIYLGEIILAFFWMTLFLIAIVSTGFFFSTFLRTRLSLAVSFGAFIFFYVAGIFSGMMPKDIEGIKYTSFFYYFDPSNLLLNHNLDLVGLHMIVLLVYSISITALAVIIFNKRDIPV